MISTLQWTPDPYLTEVERRADGSMLLRPRAAMEMPSPRLLDRLEYWAQHAPNRTLVARRDRAGEWIHVSYAQAFERVKKIAARLIQFDLSADRPIAILSGNSIEHLLVSLAAMWVGIPYSPVSPSYSLLSSDHKKLQYVIDLLTPGMIVAFDTAQFTRAIAVVAPPDAVIVGDDGASIAGRNVIGYSELTAEPDAALARKHDQTGPDTIAKFLLTSGSTGMPKAVITTNRMMCSNAVMVRQAMPFLKEEPPVLVDWLPWNHTFGGSHNVGLVIYNGGSLYIDDGKPTPSGFTETVRNLREIAPTVYFNVPKGFESLVHHLRGDADLRRTFYSRLRAYFFAAAALSQHIWDELDALSLAELGFKIPMLSGLGATETGPSVTFTTPEGARAGVIGLPAAGNLVKLAPVEDKLEIRAKGPNISPGYWRREDLTAASRDDEGFYCMGDAVRLIDSNDPTRGLKFDGRIAEDFKLASGTWVSVGPLRAELLAGCAPYLQDVVIAGLNCDYLTALLIPDQAACAKAFHLSGSDVYGVLRTDAKLAAILRERLREHAKRHPGNSVCIRRAMILPTPPVMDAGEITDKGSINQRAVLKHREGAVNELYAEAPPRHVLSID